MSIARAPPAVPGRSQVLLKFPSRVPISGTATSVVGPSSVRASSMLKPPFFLPMHPWGTLVLSGALAGFIAWHAAGPQEPWPLIGAAGAIAGLLLLAFSGCALSTAAAVHLQHERRAVLQASDVHQATIEALAMAIEAKDSSSYAQLRQVQRLAGALAKRVGLPPLEQHAVRTAALLHDIGMLAVPPHIVAKTGPLTPEELQKIRVHARLGADIIRHVPFPMPVAPLIECHHERWDGTGYPDGLRGEAIPLGARIIAVVDRFGALLADRPHRPARSWSQAIDMLRAEAGTGFDPALVAAFIDMLPEFEQEFPVARGPVPGDRDERARAGAAAATGAGPVAPDVLDHIARANREFYELFEMSRSLVTLSLSDTMALVAARLSDLIPTACVALFLEEDGRLWCRWARGLDADLVRPLSFLPDDGLVGEVYRSARAARALLPPEPASAAARRPYALRAAIACPLIVGGTTIGVLWVAHDVPAAFENDHVRVLDAVGRHAARVFHNALLFERTRQEAVTDRLTGLLNSRGLVAQFEQTYGSVVRDGERVSVLMMDVDDLKAINDTFGHAMGDVVLREVARTIRSVLRPMDLCARWSGDEYVAVLGGCTLADAERRALDLEATLATRPIALAPGESGYLRVSIGAAAFPDQGRTLESLMAAADSRMYREKQRHKQDRSPVPGQAVS